MPTRPILTALIVLASLAGVARGERSEEKAMAAARRLAEKAQVHFDLGEYDAAVDLYRDAYRIVPSPGLLYNLGQAYRLMGDCVAATTMYRNYLRLAPRSPYRSMVKHHLAALDDCVEERNGGEIVLASTRKGSELRLDDLGDMRSAEGPESPGRTRRITGVGLGIGGAALALTGVAFAIDSALASSEVSRLYDQGAPWEQIESADARGRRSERVSTTLLAGGAVAAAAGAAFYYLGWREDRRATTITATPSAGGASVSMGWSF